MNMSFNYRTLNTPPARNGAYFLLGGLALLANKLRYTLRGYRNPRPFSGTEYVRAIAYDLPFRKPTADMSHVHVILCARRATEGAI